MVLKPKSIVLSLSHTSISLNFALGSSALGDVISTLVVVMVLSTATPLNIIFAIYFAPFLLACCISEMIRTSVIPDILPDFLPGDF